MGRIEEREREGREEEDKLVETVDTVFDWLVSPDGENQKKKEPPYYLLHIFILLFTISKALSWGFLRTVKFRSTLPYRVFSASKLIKF